MPSPDPTRADRLRALGVTPYLMRGACTPSPVSTQQASGKAPTPGAAPVAAPCVLILPADCSPRQLDLVGRAMDAFGRDFARAPRIRAGAGGLDDPPPVAGAYLVFGQEQARALGHALSSEIMQQAEVVLLDAPDRLSGGESKRGIWLALKTLRRRLRES